MEMGSGPHRRHGARVCAEPEGERRLPGLAPDTLNANRMDMLHLSSGTPRPFYVEKC
jgi:hypothetical protein